MRVRVTQPPLRAHRGEIGAGGGGDKGDKRGLGLGGEGEGV